MKIVIDLEKMRVTHKHPLAKTAAGLAYIELRHGHYLIDDPDAKGFLSTLTDMEMKMLYRNLTGGEIHFLGASLKGILSEIIERLPDTDANGFEVETQASKIEDSDKQNYRYAKGAYQAAIVQSVFDFSYKAEKNQNEPMVAAQRRQRYSDTKLAATAAVAPPVYRAPATKVATTQQNPVQRPTAAPRQSGVKDTIWQVADKLWKEKNSPTDKKIVLDLRKHMMEVLEKEHGVKRNTSSNELGNWMKARVPA